MMDQENKKSSRVILKDVLRLLSIPLILMLVYLLFFLLWKLFSFPSAEELIEIVKIFFDKYGLLVVFISALIEGVLLLGQYFPGGLIIFLGVITAGKNVSRVIEVVLIVSLAFVIAYSINYLLGKYGWYKLFSKFGLKNSLDNAQKKLHKHAFNAIILSYWEPNLSSITATAAGILKYPFKRFIGFSTIVILSWNVLWAILIFSLGEVALKLTGFKYILIIFLIWVVVIVLKYSLVDRKKFLQL